MSFVRVMSVSEVRYAILRKSPPDIVVSAVGTVPTSGWNNPHLTPWIYVSPPEDGIQDFDFIAERPEGVVLQYVAPILGQGELYDVDVANYWGEDKPLLGFRVHAASNFEEILLGDEGQEAVKV